MINVDGNWFGIRSVAGKLLIFGNVSATNNTFGLFTNNNGTLRLIPRIGTNNIDNNLNGVRVDGSFLQLNDATFSENSVDVFLRFAAKDKFRDTFTTSVVCDGIVFTDGSVACP
jgi:hypothetical protein